MNNSKNPYEKNSYLKKDEEVLKEILFFERFGLKQEKTPIEKDDKLLEDDEKEK